MARARILIASASREILEQLSEALQGYEIIPAGTAALASIELVERGRPDAAIWDLAPAGEFAVDALEAVRALKPGLPIIALDETPAARGTSRRSDLGGLKVLAKPVSTGLLLAALERLLQSGP